MSRFFAIVNLVSLLGFCALIVGFLFYVQKEKDEIERLKLAYAIDYSTDAGIRAMLLDTGSLGLDYAHEKKFTLNPDLAMDAFLNVFAFNYDMLPTEGHKRLISEYIPVAAVTTYDGYYIAEHRVTTNRPGIYAGEGDPDDADWELAFGMKLPYVYENGNTKYALNMGLADTVAYDGSTIERREGLPPTPEGPSMTREIALRIINDKVSNHMAEAIEKLNEANYAWSSRFYIPSQLSDRVGVNPITGPSFLVLVQNLQYFSTTNKLSGFSVAGSSVGEARQVVGYMKDGSRYYAFADKLPDGAVPQALFDSMEEAARAEYRFDAAAMKTKVEGGGVK
ncbi:hypothetical protein [Cohnella panacarvi]|uniref:hypothetical protein n=1 Tax=Cohnella panacarvi TaxID=400776 RepID=UPI00047BED3F|nr:hypothetical protein [Cohnella panacarvi]